MEEEVEGRNLIKAMSNAKHFKNLDILLINVMPTRKIHKKMKQRLQGKKVMMRTHY